MYNILISGYYGFDNIGDESILRKLRMNLTCEPVFPGPSIMY